MFRINLFSKNINKITIIFNEYRELRVRKPIRLTTAFPKIPLGQRVRHRPIPLLPNGILRGRLGPDLRGPLAAKPETAGNPD